MWHVLHILCNGRVTKTSVSKHSQISCESVSVPHRCRVCMMIQFIRSGEETISYRTPYKTHTHMERRVGAGSAYWSVLSKPSSFTLHNDTIKMWSACLIIAGANFMCVCVSQERDVFNGSLKRVIQMCWSV